MALVDDDVTVRTQIIGCCSIGKHSGRIVVNDMGRGWQRTDMGSRLVEECNVSRCPLHVVDRFAARPLQQQLLGIGEQRARCRLDQRRRSVQVSQQHLGRQERPDAVDEFFDLGIVANGGRKVGTSRNPGTVARLTTRATKCSLVHAVQPIDDERSQLLATLVVQAVAAPRSSYTLGKFQSRHPKFVDPVPHNKVVFGHTLARVHRLADELRHPRITLETSDLRRIAPAALDPVYKIIDRRHLDTGFPQGRKHPGDVTHERSVWANDQDTLAFQREPVGVQQIRGPMEGDRCLAGTRPALHNHHAMHVGADDLILFNLDGRHNVSHVRAAGTTKRSQQCSGADEGTVVALKQFDVEDLVVDRNKRLTVGSEMTPPVEPERVASGRSVERLGDRGTPVDNHRVLLGIENRHTAQVELFAVDPVDPAKHQRFGSNVEPCKTIGRTFAHHVTLEARLMGATRFGDHIGGDLTGRIAHLVEAAERESQVGLLTAKLVDDMSRRVGFGGAGSVSIGFAHVGTVVNVHNPTGPYQADTA